MCKNYNSSKRSLVTTLVVLAICLVIVTGSTFSLFTSQTGANIAITAGNVEMVATISGLKLFSKEVAQTNNFENGGTAELTNENKTLTITNITPGDKVELTINLKNSSTVDVAYRVTWAIEGELAKVLTATVDGKDFTAGTSEWTTWAPTEEATKTITVAVEFPMGLFGTDYEKYDPYMGETANIKFAVEAVQANATTEYDPTAYVNTEAGLQAAIDAGATKIILNNDIELDKPLILGGNTYSLRTAPQLLTFDLNGKKLTGATTKDAGAVVINNGNFKIVGGTIENTAVNGGATIQNNGTLVLDGVTVIGAPMDATGYPEYAVDTYGKLTVNAGTSIESDRGTIRTKAGAEVVINGGSFVVSNAADGRNMTIHTIYAYGSGAKLTIYDGYFEQNHTSISGASVICPAGATIDIYGGDFRDAMDDTYWQNTANFQNYMGYGAPVNVYGGTFDDTTVNKNLAAGYKAVANTDGTYTVLFPQESFDSLIENAGENATIEIPAGNYTFPASDLKAGQTLNCAPGTVFEGSTGLNANGATIIGATFSNPTGAAGTSTVNGYYKNCTFDGKNGLRWCYAGDVVVFENCVFSGDTYGVHFDGGAKEVKFIDCTFSGFNAIAGDVKLTMEGCTFVANGRSNYNGINLWGSATLTNCTFVFDGKAGNEWVDARGSNTTLTFTGCVVTDGETTEGIETVVGNYGTGNTITIDGTPFVTSSDDLAAAISNGATKILLSSGNYALRFTNNTSFNVNNLTIKGLGEVNLAISSSEAWYGRVQGSNVTFENIHFTSSVGATGKATYNKCIFDSWAICASSNKEETYYNNCTINGCLNTSTDFSSGDVYVKDCKIAKAEYSGSMTMYFENCQIEEVIIWNSNTYFTNCNIANKTDNCTTATVTIVTIK